MKLKRLFCFTACICLLSLILISGCGEPEPEAVKLAPEPEQPLEETIEVEVEAPAEPEIPVPTAEPGVDLALQFNVGDVTSYQVKIIDTQEVKWEGSVPGTSKFQDGRNNLRIQVKFTQEILEVDDKSTAIARITIDDLKYRSIIKNETVINFDSSDTAPGSVLSNLIGKSYTISMKPNGVVGVIDNKGVVEGFFGSTKILKAARDFVKEDAIKKRHSLLLLPDEDKNPLQTEDKWSNTIIYPFGMMGSNAYERIYTFEDIEENNDGKRALVYMEAIPSAETGEAAQTGGMADMFDAQETYTGQLSFDLDNGRVEEYSEKLGIQWIAVMPGRETGDPPVLKMSAGRSYVLEKIE
jgi:hypothetical protein